MKTTFTMFTDAGDDVTYTVEWGIVPAQNGGQTDPSWGAYPYMDGDITDEAGNVVSDPAVKAEAKEAMNEAFWQMRRNQRFGE